MGLQGKLGYREIADLFNTIEVARKSGVMRIFCASKAATLFFEWGELIRAESNRFSDRIGALLVEHGAVCEAEVAKALELQAAESGGRKLGNILCAEFGVSEEDIQLALAIQFKAIVSDLVAWPGGAFVFDFSLPEGEVDRFALNASEFLLEVGIEAGLLARATDVEMLRVVLAEGDGALAEKLIAALEGQRLAVTLAADGEALATSIEGDSCDAYLIAQSFASEFLALCGDDGRSDKAILYGSAPSSSGVDSLRYVRADCASDEGVAALAERLGNEARSLVCERK